MASGGYSSEEKGQGGSGGYFSAEEEKGTLYDTTQFCHRGGEQQRLSALNALGLLDTPREHIYDNITALMKKMFNTPCSHLVLIDPTRCWFKSWQGRWVEFEKDEGHGPYVQCAREDGWCNYILVPTTSELLLIEDAHKDARTAENIFVTGPPHFRFYAGAPLVGRGGVRYGTLCVVDFVPRSFSAEQYAMLINFAHLVVEEMECNKGFMDAAETQLSKQIDNCFDLELSLRAVRDGVLMMDMRESSWPILYANAKMDQITGQMCIDSAFWDVFEHGDRKKLDLALHTGLGNTFRLKVFCRKTSCLLELQLLPVSSDRFASSKATGQPAWLPFGAAAAKPKLDQVLDSSKCYWFAVAIGVCESGTIPTIPGKCIPGLQSRSSSMASTTAPPSNVGSSLEMDCYGSAYGEHRVPEDLRFLELGPLLGTGSFGKVYRAIGGDGDAVAVKVILCKNSDDQAVSPQLREIQLNACLDHPNIVKVLSYAVGSDEVGKHDVLWMVQELCDLGTLCNGVELGWFRSEYTVTSPANMRLLLRTLLEVAKAMAYVHSQGVIHADLTGRNVLLSSAEGRRFVAKVADFGMSHFTLGHAFATNTLGTITHMPPEMLKTENSVLVPAADVWAFGIISWEVYHGRRCYHGRNAAQIVIAVTRQHALEWKPGPEAFLRLMETCLRFDHAERPSFASIEHALTLLQEEGQC
eukprot:TRINITY_DN29094_c0_g1_i1.p1 TRINITY_DN29094_c0_g1~~TRINITY_DN29094_c0_g1_i1.p1  ORF type:complete len:719 (+),score=125.45 TRINITY_DN29094_c0_g1_i1:70-2157(+)